MSQYIFRAQIAPVQTFITASRKTRDLYISSQLISQIALAGILEAESQRGEMLFPVKVNGKYPSSVPHLFSCILSADTDADVQRFGGAVEKAFRDAWEEIARKVRHHLERRAGTSHWTPLFNAQIERFLEVYWVAVVYTSDRHSKSYAESVRALASRKNLRHFPIVSDEGAGARKCTLTGAMAALSIDWKKFEEVEVRANEALGAIAAVKRFAQDAGVLGGVPKPFDDLDSIASDLESADEPPYVAILHMDGDSMGKYLYSCPDAPALRAFTEKLSAFAEKSVPDILRQYPGAALVYAGGDDVLAFLPAREALSAAHQIQAQFRQQTGLTMSAGIALAPYDYPLDLMLNEARKAEKYAKEKYGRDAVCVIEVHGGQTREAGARWAQLTPFHHLLGYFVEKKISAKFGYQLRLLADEMGGTVSAEARLLEVERLLSRRAGNDLSEAETKALAYEVCIVAEAIEEAIEKQKPRSTAAHATHSGFVSMANWAILARFLEKRVGK